MLGRVLVGSLKCHASLFVGCKTQNDHIIGKRGEELATVGDTVHLIAGSGYSTVQIQFTVVIAVILMTLKLEQQTAGSLVRHAVRSAKESLVNPLIGLLVFLIENHLLYIGQSTCSFGIIVPVR